MSGSCPTIARMQTLLAPLAGDVPQPLVEKLLAYLQLLLKWNARTNLTAIRDPEAIVVRHFGESLFAAKHLPTAGGMLLDIGSGAGFPGLPIALAKPDWRVTLAESQGKKAAFLQEAARVLNVDVEIWPRRVEALPPERQFGVVTLRAVDESTLALAEARRRVADGGLILHLDSAEDRASVAEDATVGRSIPVPGSQRRVLRIEEG